MICAYVYYLVFCLPPILCQINLPSKLLWAVMDYHYQAHTKSTGSIDGIVQGHDLYHPIVNNI